MSVEPQYLRLTEETNALDYLERAYEFIKLVDADPLAWKWVVISLHGALYGFAVCANTLGNPDNVMEKPKRNGRQLSHLEARILSDIAEDPALKRLATTQLMEHRKRLEKGREDRLLGFPAILELSQQPGPNRNPLQLTEQQRRSINQLHEEFRNNFLHYQPMAWSIELHGMPRMALDALAAIRFLALESSGYIHLDKEQRARIEFLVSDSIRLLKLNELYTGGAFIEQEAHTD